MRGRQMAVAIGLVVCIAAPLWAQPNYRGRVQEIYNAGAFSLSSPDGCWSFVEAVGETLHASDPAVGFLRKDPGRTHVVDRHGRLVGADVLLYRLGDRGQVIDIVQDCGGPNAGPGWSITAGDTYPLSDWYAPIGMPAPDPVPVPTTGDLQAVLDLMAEDHASLRAQLAAAADREVDLLRRMQAFHDVLLDHAAQPMPPPISIPPPQIDDGDSVWVTVAKIAIPAVAGAVGVCIQQKCWK